MTAKARLSNLRSVERCQADGPKNAVEISWSPLGVAEPAVRSQKLACSIDSTQNAALEVARGGCAGIAHTGSGSLSRELWRDFPARPSGTVSARRCADQMIGARLMRREMDHCLPQMLALLQHPISVAWRKMHHKRGADRSPRPSAPFACTPSPVRPQPCEPAQPCTSPRRIPSLPDDRETP